jgi:hypothetical protein
MKRFLACLACVLAFAVPRAASAEGVQASIGYAFTAYLEEGGGGAPVGAFLSLSGRDGFSLELDLGWQRDTDDSFSQTITLNTYTAVAGPRFGLASSGVIRPYVHVLGGVRHDRIEDESNTAWGGFAGLGIDIQAGDSLAIRVGSDFQVFFDEGENVKTLRVGIGLTF